MSALTDIKTRIKKNAQDLKAAQRREAKADAAARTAAQNLNDARGGVEVQVAEHARLAAILKLEDSGSSKTTKAKVTKGKPGPKPKALKAAPKVKAPKGKPGPKPKAAKAVKAKAAPSAARNQSRAAQGRREVASGKRLPIKEVIAKVLGKRVMNAQQVYEAIKEKGTLPNSGDPRGYIGYMLSASKATIKKGGKDVEVPLFERVPEKGRGFYKNRGVDASKASAALKAAPAKAVKAKPAKAAKTAPKAAAAPKGPTNKDGKRTVTCKKCGKTGHNSKGHDRAVAAATMGGSKTPKAVKPAAKTAPKAAAAPKVVTGEKKTVTCKVCNTKGHNSKGHDRWASSKALPAKTNGHATAAKAAPAKAEATEGATGEKKTVTCKVCNTKGHNSKGHDKWAKAKMNGSSTHTPAKPKVEKTEPEAPKASEPKSESKAEKAAAAEKAENLATDAILRGAGIEIPAAVSP